MDGSTFEEMAELKVINFFITEKDSESICCGKINWKTDKITLNCSLFSGNILDFFTGIFCNTDVGLYFTKLDAINKTNNFN